MISDKDSSRINVDNTVAEITTIISQKLIEVFKQVSNENNHISQNLKILNQLPFVVKLRDENISLSKQLKKLNFKYKACLEELIVLKSDGKVTMEITELDSTLNTIVPSQADIESTIKNPNDSCALWGLDDSGDSDDSDAQSFSYVKNVSILNDPTSRNRLEQLKNDPKNKDVSEARKKTAINRWKLFYKDNQIINCNKPDNDIIEDIMKSSAGLKGWSAPPIEIKATTTNSFSVLTEDNEDDDEDEDDDDDEEDDEDDEDDEEDDDDEEDEDEDEDKDNNKEKEENNIPEEKVSALVQGVLAAQNAPPYATIDTASEKSDFSDDDEEVEVEELKFENKTYYTDDSKNGNLFECLDDGEIGNIIGHLENGAVFFS